MFWVFMAAGKKPRKCILGHWVFDDGDCRVCKGDTSGVFERVDASNETKPVGLKHVLEKP